MHAILILAALTVVASDDVAEVDAEASQESARREEVARVALAKVRPVTVTVAGDTSAVLRPGSLLRWSNPTVGAVYGEVFLWTVGNRPVALASVYCAYDPPWGWNLELVSTCASPVRASEQAKILWDTPTAGVEFRPFADASPPGEKAAARLRQMRKLAERFSAELADGRNNQDVNRRLRLLSQPVYRYSIEEQNVLDGALFAVVEATDPELWILLEARQDEKETSWRYALARMDSWPMQVRLDGQIVQRWEKIEKPWTDRKSPYTLCPFSPDLAASEPRQTNR